MKSNLEDKQQHAAVRGGLWQTLVGGWIASAFTPLGLALLVIIAILPNVPPFNQEHMLRWLIAGAFLGRPGSGLRFHGRVHQCG